MSRTEKKRNLIGIGMLALLIIVAAGVFTLIIQNHQASMERDEAQSSAATSQQLKKNLAEEVADACQSGQVIKSSAGVDLCTRAATIAKQPVTLEGPQGPAGPRGLPGVDGDDGKGGAAGSTGKAGVAGIAGLNGKDSTAPGPAGLPGASSTVPGPMGPVGPAGPAGKDGAPGKDSTTAGPAGLPGAPGAAGTTGRGIADVQCVGDGTASYWLITYTDGTTAQSSGPCKVTVPAPTDEPTP